MFEPGDAIVGIKLAPDFAIVQHDRELAMRGKTILTNVRYELSIAQGAGWLACRHGRGCGPCWRSAEFRPVCGLALLARGVIAGQTRTRVCDHPALCEGAVGFRLSPSRHGQNQQTEHDPKAPIHRS